MIDPLAEIVRAKAITRNSNTGSYRAEHLFALEQALALYDAYHEKASACDARIEAVLKELSIHRGHGHGSAPRASRGM